MNGTEYKDKQEERQQYKAKSQKNEFKPYDEFARYLTKQYGAQEASLILEEFEAQQRLQKKSR
ncbi:MAG: hypothetical protein N3D75_03870 [Candidatus Aenigmarchaeota archaeon]|nr:hypothetical protein [Candidatus Aenigmarchaeota archaeon]